VAPGRVEGVLLVASFAPFDAEGLDYVDGMGTQNAALFGTAAHGVSLTWVTTAGRPGSLFERLRTR
jgi:hypothetical protein